MLGLLSRSANVMPENRGSMLPTWAKCQIRGESFNRVPLNDRGPVVGEGQEMPTLAIAVGGEEVDFKVLATAKINDDLLNEVVGYDISQEI